MEWRFMYLLPDWFAATPARAAPSRWNRILAIAAGQHPRMNARSPGIDAFGLIHCALRTHPRASSGTRLLKQNLRVLSWKTLSSPVRQAFAGLSHPWRSLPSSGLTPIQNKWERPESLPRNAMPEAQARAPRLQLRLEVCSEGTANRSARLAHSKRVARQTPVADDAQRAVRVLAHEHPL